MLNQPKPQETSWSDLFGRQNKTHLPVFPEVRPGNVSLWHGPFPPRNQNPSALANAGLQHCRLICLKPARDCLGEGILVSVR